jgi:hypothetical protein
VEPELRERLSRLCSAYGADVSTVLDELLELQETELRRTETLGAQGRSPWRVFLDRGDADEIRREMQWLRRW